MTKTRLLGSTLFLLSLSILAWWRTDFSLAKIAIPLLQERDPFPHTDVEWPQTFRYLGRGRQCFAFESLDGQYVLKFFDGAEVRPRPVSKPRRKRPDHWADRARLYPESYRIALQNMPRETGLLIVHQGQSAVEYPTVEVIDQASRRFQVDLNQVPFVLQKKGTGTFLHRLARAASPQEFEQLIDQFLAFHAKRISLSIADGDRDIKRNYAWDGDQILYIDPARFCRQSDLQESALEHAVWAATYRLRKWIMRNAPGQLTRFDQQVEQHRCLFER